mgnify:FL=1
MNEETIIVGSSVYALLLSYHKKLPIILTSFQPPSADQLFEKSLLVEGISFNRQSDCWEFLKFLLSQSGLVKNSTPPTYVRVEDNIYFNSSGQKLELKYNKCLLFSDHIIKCANEIKKVENKGIYRVLDFLKLKYCDVSGLNPLKPKHTYISEIIFEGSKDIICVSFLNKEQLLNFDYSDTMSRFIVEREILNTDFKQPFLDKEKKYKRKPSPTVVSRQVESVERVIYKDSEKIENYGYNDERLIEQAYRRYRAGLKD